MRTFILLLLLMPLYAEASNPPELVCEPDARILFQSRWLRGSVLKLESTDANWELPWSGREPSTSGLVLRNERLQELASTEAANEDTLLNTVPEESRFVVFRSPGVGKNPLVNILYVDSDLLEQGAHDGLVISQQQQCL